MANLTAFLTAKYFPKSGELLVFGDFRSINSPKSTASRCLFMTAPCWISSTTAFVPLFRNASPSITPSKPILHLSFRLPASDLAPLAPLAFSLEYAIQGLRPETLPASQELWKSLTLGKASRRVLQETFAIASQSLGWGLQLRAASKGQQLIIASNLSLQRGHVDSLPEDSCACFSGTGPPPESCKSAPGS